ncbi:MAG: hypothetical protein ABIK89_05830, partial [Planctomycetota bacterium]
MKRVLCAWLPQWPLQHLYDMQPELRDRTVLLHTDAGRGTPRIVACSHDAARRGVVPGMSVAEARALYAQCGERTTRRGGDAERGRRGDTARGRRGEGETRGRGEKERNSGRRIFRPIPASLRPRVPASPCLVRHDPQADLASLRKLAMWCQWFSPVTGVEEPDSLLLDVTGCSHLFGGEQELAETIVEMLRLRGFSVRVAVADTIGAAWAVSHFSRCLLKPIRSDRIHAVFPPENPMNRVTTNNSQRAAGTSPVIVPPGGHPEALLRL